MFPIKTRDCKDSRDSVTKYRRLDIHIKGIFRKIEATEKNIESYTVIQSDRKEQIVKTGCQLLRFCPEPPRDPPPFFFAYVIFKKSLSFSR